MVKIRQVDVSCSIGQGAPAANRALSPTAQARQKQHRQFMRMISKISDLARSLKSGSMATRRLSLSGSD